MQKASSIFKDVLHNDPNNRDALVFLCVSYCLSGHPGAARPISERLLQIDPITANSYALPPTIELHNGNIEGALPLFQKWITLDPIGPFVRFWWANILALNNELEKSIEVLDTIIKETPALVFAKYALFFKSALNGDKEGVLKYATDELRCGAELLDYLPIYMAFGYVLVDEKDEAVRWLKKSLDFGVTPYPLMVKWEIFHRVLKGHAGFDEYMEEVKERAEQFEI